MTGIASKAATAQKKPLESKSKAIQQELEDKEDTHYNFKVPQLFPENPTPRGTTGIAAKAAAIPAEHKLVPEEKAKAFVDQKAMSHA